VKPCGHRSWCACTKVRHWIQDEQGNWVLYKREPINHDEYYQSEQDPKE